MRSEDIFVAWRWIMRGLLCLIYLPVTAQQEGIRWLSFHQLSDSMAVQTRPIFISIYTTWCPYCRLLEKRTYQDAQVITFVNQNFYALQLNAEGKEPISFAGQTYTFQPNGNNTGIHQLALLLVKGSSGTAYPTLVILNKEYAPTFRQSGFLKPKDLLNALARRH